MDMRNCAVRVGMTEEYFYKCNFDATLEDASIFIARGQRFKEKEEWVLRFKEESKNYVEEDAMDEEEIKEPFELKEEAVQYEVERFI